MTTTTVEAVQQTLAEYERLAIGTGEWNGTDAPEFSNDGIEWSTAWLPTGEHPHPVLARATVYRKGVDRPVVAVIRWDEALPALDEWRDLWLRKPIALFGAFAKRAALRSAFRDVLADRTEPDETTELGPVVNGDRDWFAELNEASTGDAVQQLHRDAKFARAVTVELETAIRRRLAHVRGLAIGSLIVETNDIRAAVVERVSEAFSNPAPSSPIAKLREGGVVKPSPKPAPPKVRLEDTVRRPKTGRRPQKPKSRGPHA